ncbi:MAG: hypothetical protein IJU92_00145 [Spirochaetaceae bacterium]|nr:hypothetical protein [Spirochaetaceae bacterium]
MGSIVWALIGGLFVAVGFMPLFGWVNWLAIIFLVLGIISGVNKKRNIANKVLAIIGILLCIVFLIAAIFRLVAGFGVI